MGVQPSPSPDNDVVQIGSVLDGRYRIDAILGSGGMGRVYRGEHTGIGRQVAIKVLHADLGRNREAAQRFQREALASGRLDHLNIVGVSDFGVLDDGPCYLVMEALEGESLGDKLQRESRIAWPEAIEIIRGVLAGLRHAHDRGVVHRDIKPDNIFLARKEGELVVKILDFGIAKLAAGTGDDPASTRAGLTVGTPAYLSPEQAVGGAITPACDLYSTTIVLFEMLAGRAPFEDKDPLAMLGAHVGRPPPRIAEVAPDVQLAAGLEDIIQAGLAKVVGDRIPTAGDYLGLLEQVAPEQPRVRSSAPVSAVYLTPPAGELGMAATAALATTPRPSATPFPGSTLQTSELTFSAVTGPLTPHPGVPVRPARPARPTSIAEAPDPIPKKWIAIGGVTLVALLIVAFILAVAKRDSPAVIPMPVPIPPPKIEKPLPKPPAKPPRAADVAPEPPPPPPVQETVPDPKELALKAAFHDLEQGKTCADRKKAIGQLVALGDPRALGPLKTARYRMRGGFLGFNQDNTNACLRVAADAAIKALAPPKAGSAAAK